MVLMTGSSAWMLPLAISSAESANRDSGLVIRYDDAYENDDAQQLGKEIDGLQYVAQRQDDAHRPTLTLEGRIGDHHQLACLVLDDCHGFFPGKDSIGNDIVCGRRRPLEEVVNGLFHIRLLVGIHDKSAFLGDDETAGMQPAFKVIPRIEVLIVHAVKLLSHSGYPVDRNIGCLHGKRLFLVVGQRHRVCDHHHITSPLIDIWLRPDSFCAIDGFHIPFLVQVVVGFGIEHLALYAG